jgi:hypothetical protein
MEQGRGEGKVSFELCIKSRMEGRRRKKVRLRKGGRWTYLEDNPSDTTSHDAHEENQGQPEQKKGKVRQKEGDDISQGESFAVNGTFPVLCSWTKHSQRSAQHPKTDLSPSTSLSIPLALSQGRQALADPPLRPLTRSPTERLLGVSGGFGGGDSDSSVAKGGVEG